MLDLTAASAGSAYAYLFGAGTVDRLLAAGRSTWTAVRALVTVWLTDPTHRHGLERLLLLVADLTMRLPCTVADYVDFYASEHHRAGPRRRLVHLPVDGVSLRADDLYASGTVSGADDKERA